LPKPKKAAKKVVRSTRAKSKSAQPSYVLKVAAPKRSAKPAPVTSETIAKLQAMAQAGLLNSLTLGKANAPVKATADGLDIATLLRLYAQYRPLIDQLLPLIQGLFKKNPSKPVPDPDGSQPTPDEPDLGDGEDSIPSAQLRAAVDFGQNIHWISRKKSMEEKTGRYLISDGEKFEIWKRSTPAMQGDRCCVDNTPRDAQGRPFLPGQAENATITWQHEALGIGEIQLQEDVDFTPIFLVPWKGLEMDKTYEAGIRSTMLVNGQAVKTREHTIRVHTRGLD
jgi:hypothetical protein